ncbi:7632_t:CDS:1, partial [Scutellospora calospora]
NKFSCSVLVIKGVSISMFKEILFLGIDTVRVSSLISGRVVNETIIAILEI